MQHIKNVSLWAVALLFSFVTVVQAQDDPSKRPSPPATASGKVKGANITVNYSSPAVKGRTVWGELVPYNEVWRAGANEATTFETDKDIMVEGKALPAGKYSFFTIPGEKEWTIVFNKVAEQWGAYKYDQSEDALRVTVKPKKAKEMHERLAYEVNNKGLVLQWENMEVPVAIK
ncbi:Protein of unknown function [Catalinimonas alkaloidigena]|uniref:DUF2911 domain-containing protein n=1 Tax=Catalinimonas alkaloidigena TaxID=1075417 RepID=A0A1G9KLE6_9BACT|nr:DUF2911 domain-containing protein [Catalinimonas alkaloidigena]SDL50482.1 Protein of unknown function [Catalinimonas alkaloidigena]